MVGMSVVPVRDLAECCFAGCKGAVQFLQVMSTEVVLPLCRDHGQEEAARQAGQQVAWTEPLGHISELNPGEA